MIASMCYHDCLGIAAPHSLHPLAAPVYTAREDAHIVELVPLLSKKGLHHIPIVNTENRLVGIVAQSDLIGALYVGSAKA